MKIELSVDEIVTIKWVLYGFSEENPESESAAEAAKIADKFSKLLVSGQ